MGTGGVAYVHVGTHKTGTCSLQSMLARNDETLRSFGVFVPRSGRTDPASAGHHNIAWELGHHPLFDPARGTFDDLLDEVRDRGASTICVSSEEFEFLFEDPHGLMRLRDGFAAIGYATRIILYLRPQADYLESLYAEIVKAWDVGFDEFFESIIATGGYRFTWSTYDRTFHERESCRPARTGMCSQFAYDELAGAFGDVFGDASIVARAYRSSCSSTTLLRDFLDILAPNTIPLRRLRQPERMNRSMSFRDVIAARSRRLGLQRRHHLPPRQRFDPLSLLDLIRLTARFARSNERLAARFDVRIGTVTRGTAARELAATVVRDQDCRHRKQILRALTRDDVAMIEPAYTDPLASGIAYPA